MNSHEELASEQRYVDRAYEALGEMRRDAEKMVNSVVGESEGGTHQARYERDVFVQTALARIQQLDIGSHPLVFGRMDINTGERHYLGRVAVVDEHHTSVVVDWRAPVAESFYRATGREPMNLVLRRHFAANGQKLTGIEDERFSTDDDSPELGLAGPGALLSALEQTRTGRMRDIVATVQREQDEIIRAPLQGLLVVQGGPGTGKTAVALHRAAYLLFTHRNRLGSQGILVIGPNPVFLRYIDQVLPALGESGAALSTIEGLVAGVRVKAKESPLAAKAKGDEKMVKFLRNAIGDRRRPLSRDTLIPFGRFGLTLAASDSAGIISSVRRMPGTHNERRRHVLKQVTRRLYSEYRKAAQQELRGGALGDMTIEELQVELAREPVYKRVLDQMWPTLSAEEFLHDLFSETPLIASAGKRLLNDAEIKALHRPHSETLRDIEWTAADMPLIDEARFILGPVKTSPDDAEPLTYGHIIVDEAQDLTPMALRMLARRSHNGSMTLVGDLAQATGTWAPNEWQQTLAHLPSGRGIHIAELSVSYRTPSEILELANRVLAHAAPTLKAPEAVRSSGMQPRIVRTSEVGAQVAQFAKQAPESIAIIAVASMIEEMADALTSAGVTFGRADTDGLDQPVTLVDVAIVKGLEFDEALVVEPARILREAPQGARALYVALTRATKMLTVVHSEDLPSEMSPV